MSFRRLVAAAACAVVPFVSATAQQPARDGFLTTDDGARLHYRVAGQGRDTLIAIHGGPGMDLGSIYNDFTPLFAKHVVIFYDQRGGGESDLPADTTRLKAPRQVADLEAVRTFFHLDKVTLLAHSYGPLLAASYAIAHPDHVGRLVFFGPVPPYRADFWQRFAKNAAGRLDSAQLRQMASANARMMDSTGTAASVRKGCEDYWALGLIPRLADGARAVPKVKADLCSAPPAALRYGLGKANGIIMGSYGNWDIRAQLATVHVPALIVHGVAEAIPMDMVEEWARALPHARLLRVPGAAHFAYAEQPQVVWPAVETFLSGGTVGEVVAKR